MAEETIVNNAEDGAHPSYYTYNPSFDDIRGSSLLRLPTKIVNALRYLGL